MIVVKTLQFAGRFAPARKLSISIARILATVGVAVLLTGIATAAPQPSPPDSAVVVGAVERFFASQPNYESGDLITRSQIEFVLTKLDDAGAKVPGAKKIAERGLPNDSFLIRQFSTPAGRSFMRKLSHTPGAFVRLDRLSAIPDGEKLIVDLMHDKGGYTLIEYLATTKGGQNMGAMMAAVPGGDLNKPTGRIYTVADFVDAIKAAYAKAASAPMPSEEDAP